MPRKFTAYEPDALDCNTLCTAIYGDFALLPTITVEYGRDKVTVIVKCYKVMGIEDRVVQVQAMASAPLQAQRSNYVLQYAALLDCWHQCDRGVLSVAQAPVLRGWDGRPRTPERRKA